MRLHRERQAGHDADRDAGRSGRTHPFGTCHRGNQVGGAGHEHDVFALAEMLVGKHREQEQQHRRQQGFGKRMVRRGHEMHEAAARPEGGEDAGDHPGREPEGHRSRQDLRRQNRQAMEDEGQGQVLVEDLDIELFAADPSCRYVQDGRDVVVDRREEVPGQPQHWQDKQGRQQQSLDARRNGRGLGRNGWQGPAKIS